jgi:beta-phosphoglucomutase-like phosphatase (HAD superfamily)
MAKLKMILLDYDGTTGDSEELAFGGATAYLNEQLAARGISHVYTAHELRSEFVGCNFERICKELARKYNFTLTADELSGLVAGELERAISILSVEMLPAPGVNEVLEALHGNYGLAIVSSSALRRLFACLKRAQQQRFFASEHVFSATDSLPGGSLSKPAPDIYLHALEKLGVSADESLAVEDSPSGVESAVAAGIKVVGYVGCHAEHERQAVAAKLLAKGAVKVMYHWSEFPSILADIESGVPTGTEGACV